MEITCTHCQKALRIPDEKVPNRAFALTCPSCKKRFQVDPSSSQADDESDDMSFAGLGDEGDGSSEIAPPGDLADDLDSTKPTAAAKKAKTTTTGTIATGGFRPLRSLQPAEKQLLDRLAPVAGIINLTESGSQTIEKALDLLGIHEIFHYETVEAAADAMPDLELGLLMIKVEKASAPPFEILTPIQKIPMSIRRRTIVALMADNVRSHDGQIAFFLQVNTTISSKDMAKLPELLRRAMLHHLQLYRFWDE